MNLLRLLQERFRQALSGLVADPASAAALIRPAQEPRFGDYQANCAMSLAKALGRKPREIATEIVDRLDAADLLEAPEIAGPGFINLRMRTDWLANAVHQVAADPHLGVDKSASPRTVVIDYSSPNVAKPMHVGHLRSTVIGDALARLARFLGHHVITDNHLGDWGTQFGILLYGYKHFRDEAALKADPVREMARLYILVRGMMRADEEDEATKGDPIAEAARQETARLHAGDPENVQLWQRFMPWCQEELDRIYRRLGVHFDVTHGESFYNPMLAEVVGDLESKGVVQPGDEGSLVIFFGENEPPALVRKRDGAFTYTASDLATIRYRVEKWRPDTMLYVVDFRQALHFKHLFEAARRWGYTELELEHISFGSVLGADRRPIKTREGGSVELSALVDEAVERASQVYEQSRNDRHSRGQDVPVLSEAERQQIIEAVGLGAVKYADLSQNRTSDYVFDWDKMLAMDGNTAAYMQYVYARVRSIFRKGDEDPEPFRRHPPVPLLTEPQERALVLQLLRLSETLEAAAAEWKPNLITAYLWELAKSYNAFYQHSPVLDAETPVLRQSRLLLCDLTARTVQLGLELLGIHTVERM